MKKISIFLLLLFAGIVCATSQNVSEIKSEIASGSNEFNAAINTVLPIMNIIMFGFGILLAIAWVLIMKHYAAEYRKKDKDIKGNLDAFRKFSLPLKLVLVLLAITILTLFLVPIIMWLFYSIIFPAFWSITSRFTPP